MLVRKALKRVLVVAAALAALFLAFFLWQGRNDIARYRRGPLPGFCSHIKIGDGSASAISYLHNAKPDNERASDSLVYAFWQDGGCVATIDPSTKRVVSVRVSEPPFVQ